MPSDEVNSICLPLTPGVQRLLEDIVKALAEAEHILGPLSSSTSGHDERFLTALNAGRSYVRDLRTRLQRVLDAADAALPYDIGL